MRNLTQLITRCQQGDRQAFGELYTAYSELLKSVARRYVHDEHTVEDIVHDAFVMILLRMDRLHHTEKAEAWMAAIVKNLSLLHLRHHRQVVEVPIDELPLASIAEAPAVEQGYDGLIAAIDALPDGYRRVFRLSVLEGMTHQEIAAALHIGAHSSSSQLFRAKKMLRHSLMGIAFAALLLSVPVGVWLWRKSQSPQKPLANNRKPHRAEKKSQEHLAEDNNPLPTLTTHSVVMRATPSAVISPIVALPEVSDTTRQLAIADTTSTHERSEQSDTVSDELPTRRWLPPTEVEIQLAEHQEKQKEDWQLAMSFQGVGGLNAGDGLHVTADGRNDEEPDTLTHRSLPITLELALSRSLGQHFSLSTGLRYSWLRAEQLTGYQNAYERREWRREYLGIPLSVNWYFTDSRRWKMYVKGGGMVEFPVRAQLSHDYVLKGETRHATEEPLDGHLRWSVETGLGVQYSLSPTIGLFAEPSIRYYFLPSTATPPSDRSFLFSLPVGIRLTW